MSDLACQHESGVIVHRFRDEVDPETGRHALVRRPHHVWCPTCETALPIAEKAADA